MDSWPRNTFNIFILKNCLFGATNIKKISINISGGIVAMEQHLIEKVSGFFVMTLLGML